MGRCCMPCIGRGLSMARKRGEQPWILVLAFRDERQHGPLSRVLEEASRWPCREREIHTYSSPPICVMELCLAALLLIGSPLRALGRTPHCLLISRGEGGGGSGQNKDDSQRVGPARSRSSSQGKNVYQWLGCLIVWQQPGFWQHSIIRRKNHPGNTSVKNLKEGGDGHLSSTGIWSLSLPFIRPAAAAAVV